MLVPVHGGVPVDLVANTGSMRFSSVSADEDAGPSVAPGPGPVPGEPTC